MKTKKFLLTTILILSIFVSSMTVFAAKTGGWSVSKSTYSFVTASQKKIFNKAIKGLAGVSYKPVAVLADQVVAGTNYVYLCQGTKTTEKATRAWYLLLVNKDPKGKVKLISIEKINISKVKTTEIPTSVKNIEGGIRILPVKKKLNALPASARTAFKKATKTFVGYDLRPIALLGTQVVAGNNYKILCYGKSGKASGLLIMDIYQTPSGKSSITFCELFDLEGYLS